MVQIQNECQTMLFPPEEVAALSLKCVKKTRTDPVHQDRENDRKWVYTSELNRFFKGFYLYL